MSDRAIQLVGKCGSTLAILAAVAGLAYSLLISREAQTQTVNWVVPTLAIGFMIGLVAWAVAGTFANFLNPPRSEAQPPQRTYLTTFPLSGSPSPLHLPWPMKQLGAAWYAIGLGAVAMVGAVIGFKVGELQFDPSLLRLIPAVFGLFIAAALYVGVFRMIKPADLEHRWATIDEEENGPTA